MNGGRGWAAEESVKKCHTDEMFVSVLLRVFIQTYMKCMEIACLKLFIVFMQPNLAITQGRASASEEGLPLHLPPQTFSFASLSYCICLCCGLMGTLAISEYKIYSVFITHHV